MTTHKPTFIQNQDNNTQAKVDEGSGIQAQGFAPSPEQAMAYLYGLFSSEESAIIEQRVEESSAFQDALAISRQEQALFACWEDAPVPTGLVENTLQRIQQSLEK